MKVPLLYPASLTTKCRVIRHYATGRRQPMTIQEVIVAQPTSLELQTFLPILRLGGLGTPNASSPARGVSGEEKHKLVQIQKETPTRSSKE